MYHGFRVLVRKLLDNTPMDTAEHRQFVPTVAAGRSLGPPLAVLVLTACAALYAHVPTVWLAAALLLFTIESVVKILTGRYFLALPEAAQREGVWRRIYWGFAFQSGITYGLASLVLMAPLPPANWGIVLIVFGGIVLQFSLMSANHLPAALVCITPMILPLPLALIASGVWLNAVLALVILYVGWLTLNLCARIAGASLESIRADLENQALVHRIEREIAVADEQRAIAEQAVIDKSRFVALASHDLRQPLHALGLYQGTLRRKACTADTEALFDASDRLIGNLNELFVSMLDVSRLDAGVVEPQLDNVSLGSLLQRLHDEYRQEAQSRGIDWSVSVLPTDIALTDANLLLRILRNLVNNAFTHAGGGRIAIEVLHEEKSRLHLVVSDTGAGIAPDQLESIFDEYHRVASTASRNKGFGLGLAIVRKLAELLGIVVTVDSTAGEGTRFHLHVPAGQAARERESVAAHPVDNLEHVRVVLLDDDDRVVDAMIQTLDDWGCTVFPARSVAEAEALVSEFDGVVPDILLCDYQLADGGTGVEAVTRLRTLLGELPAIVITGESSPEAIRALSAQSLPCLTKPVLPSRLHAAMVSALASAREHDGTSGHRTA